MAWFKNVLQAAYVFHFNEGGKMSSQWLMVFWNLFRHFT